MSNKIIFLNFWDKGGMHHYSDAIVRILSKDWRVHYFSSYKNNNSNGATYYALGFNPLNPKTWICLFNIAIRIIKMRPDVIHLNNGFPALLPIYPLFVFYNSIITVHDAQLHKGESVFKHIYHIINLTLIFICFKRVIVHSEIIRDKLPKIFKKKPISIMPHVNYNHFSCGRVAPQDENARFRILFFGRILEYKGLDYLVEAFKELPENEFELVIAGEGTLPKNMSISGSMRVMNRFITDEEMVDVFNNTDVVVLPYISASQSGVVYMAFSFNKPVIISNVGAISDVVKDKRNGVLIAPRSVTDIIDAVHYVKGNMSTLVDYIARQNESNDEEIRSHLMNIYSLN